MCNVLYDEKIAILESLSFKACELLGVGVGSLGAGGLGMVGGSVVLSGLVAALALAVGGMFLIQLKVVVALKRLKRF